MDPERTTTIGDGESAAMERPFHICTLRDKSVEDTAGLKITGLLVYMGVVRSEMIRTMKAVDRMRAKLSSWAAACRGFWRLDNMTAWGYG
jgi:hypothetical protein